jgi:L-amino acid N-acyltransferase YncA
MNQAGVKERRTLPATDRERSGPAGRSGGVLVRACGPADRASIERLGHPPDVARILCPSLPHRFVWRISGTRARSVVATDGRTGAVLGCVQFVRSRRSPDAWMFGHWRVLAARRQQGIGRTLLEEGLRQCPETRHLYSYVESDNEISRAAHERLGFEAGRTLRGTATLGALSTLGAATPALTLRPAGARDWDALFGIYARAMGCLWLRLFPGIGPRNFLVGARGGVRALAIAVARESPAGSTSTRAGAAAGFVVWRASGPTFYADPEFCDPGLLARAAIQILARGSRREDEVRLRGLPRSLAGRPGAIMLQELMGMPDIRTQWIG